MAKSPRLQDQDVRQVAYLIEKGWSDQDICQLTTLEPRLVSRIRTGERYGKVTGFTLDPKRKERDRTRLTEIEKERAILFYSEGMTPSEIAVILSRQALDRGKTPPSRTAIGRYLNVAVSMGTVCPVVTRKGRKPKPITLPDDSGDAWEVMTAWWNAMNGDTRRLEQARKKGLL